MTSTRPAPLPSPIPDLDAATGDFALEFSHIVKDYPGVRAVDDVSLRVRRGEVHALVGENGAGKSTLMGIASGIVRPESGVVTIDGTAVVDPSPALAAELGLAIVYQHSSTISDLTIRENLILGSPPSRRISFARSGDIVTGILRDAGIDVHPDTRVSSLSTAERQLLEIAKALSFDCKVLILDEPTESLTQDESERLFEKIRAVKAAGTAVVYISHRLADVRHISDTLTILRDGRSRGSYVTAELSELQVVELMIGRAFNHTFPPKADSSVGQEPVLRVEDFDGDHFHDVGLSVAAGEILGIAGVEGNGQREFLRALAGVQKFSGTVTVGGRRTSISSVRGAQRHGVYYLPGDRHLEGLLMDMTVAENATLLSLPQFSTAGMLSAARERRLADSLVKDFDVRTPSASVPISSLSGGNQQKVLLGRVVAPGPRVLLVEEPTRGVDVGARAEIYVKLRELARSGVAVVVLSSDAVELAGLCDRVAVFSRGTVAATLSGDDLTERTITGTALTAATEKKAKAAAAGTRTRSRSRLSRFLGGDYFPTVVVLGLLACAAIVTQTQNDRFLSPYSIFSMLVLASVLALAGYGQSFVIFTGGIDLSIGPMIAVSIVILSYFGSEGGAPGGILLGIAVALVAGVLVGLVNAVLTRILGLPSVLSTLITGIALQGVALLLRPVPGGRIVGFLAELKNLGIGILPYVFLGALVIGLLLELFLRRSRRGLDLRATGADAKKARMLGARTEPSHFLAYVLSSTLATIAGVVLASVVGIGDPQTGLTYTLLTVTVAVLAGTSVFGGRGTLIGVMAAAVLLQVLNSATAFLQLGTAWQQWLPAILILAGAAVFSRIREGQSVTS
jgi:ribose transport system ATP-binding protein